MDERIIEEAIGIFQPVLESAMVLAAQYAKSTGRDVVSAEDTHYAMRFCARNVTMTALFQMRTFRHSRDTRAMTSF